MVTPADIEQGKRLTSFMNSMCRGFAEIELTEHCAAWRSKEKLIELINSLPDDVCIVSCTAKPESTKVKLVLSSSKFPHSDKSPAEIAKLVVRSEIKNFIELEKT